ncbi:MAG: cysteine rich repeat-containing protein [Bdellovibrionales bacterium]
MSRFLLLSLLSLTTSFANAQGGSRGQGPVATQCKTEIEKFCADKKHEHGEVRLCLEAKKDELSAKCKLALESTGPKKGQHK